jgi:hypothetical protein
MLGRIATPFVFDGSGATGVLRQLRAPASTALEDLASSLEHHA